MRKTILILAALLLTSAPAVAQYSAVNQTLSLGGAGYLSVPYNSSFNAYLNSSGAVSMDAWVRPAALGADMTIVGNDLTMGYWFGVTAAGKLRWKPTTVSQTFESNGAVTANTWTHVAIAYNFSHDSLRFYINGVLDRALVVYKLGLGMSQGDLRIGGDRSAAGGPVALWNGQLDEVRVWNTAIDFATASGSLHLVPHAVDFGRYGRFCVAAWRMNGSGADHANGLDASAVGTVSWSSSPVPPHYTHIGAQFNNGNNVLPLDFMAVHHNASLAALNNFTVECLVKVSATGGAANLQTIACKGNAVSAQWAWWLGINKSNNKLRFVPSGNMNDWLESSGGLATNMWYHVAARFQQTSKAVWTATLYLNGSPSATRTFSSAASSNTYDVIIGAATNSRAANVFYGFSGIIEELRFWNDARTEAEIDDNQSIEIPAGAAGLSANYHFNGDGDDASGSGSDVYTGFSISDLYFVNTEPGYPLARILVTAPNGGERWTIGSTQKIRWNIVPFHAVRIDISRDGGMSWPDTIATAAPTAGSGMDWMVTGPATSNALIRISTRTPTGVEDVSNAVFEIVEAPPIISASPSSIAIAASQNGAVPTPVRVTLTNAGGQTLDWYVLWSATWLQITPSSGSGNTDHFDAGVQTTALAPGTYMDTLVINGNAANGGFRIPVSYQITAKKLWSISGTLRNAANEPVHSVRVDATGEALANARTDSLGHYEIKDLPAGDYSISPTSNLYTFNPPVRTYAPLNNNITGADFAAVPAHGSVRIRFEAGWNLMSLPVIPDDGTLTTVFPMAIPPAYAYDPAAGYVVVTVLQYGKGYWVKFPQEDSADVTGTLQQDMVVTLQSTSGGWNMIGAPASYASVNSRTQVPPGIITAFYEHDQYGYYAPFGNQLRPGHGYFVRAGAPGTVTFRGWGSGPTSFVYRPPSMFVLPVRDGSGPPPPPR